MNRNLEKCTGNAPGFTLIEVLVSLAILAVALAIITPIYSYNLQRQKFLIADDAAILYCKSILDRLGSEISLVDGSTECVSENPFTCHVDIAPYGSIAPGGLLSAKLATVTIGWPDKARWRSLTVSTVRVTGHD